MKFEKDVYNIVFSWEDEIEYLENVEAFVDIDYILPLTTVSEVVSLDTTNRTARMYFEFDQTLQYSFFETLKVEVFDENGQNQTNLFSIQIILVQILQNQKKSQRIISTSIF